MAIESQPPAAALGPGCSVLSFKPLNCAIFDQVHTAFLEQLALPDQHCMTVGQHLAFSRCFGRLKTDFKTETILDGHSDICANALKCTGGA